MFICRDITCGIVTNEGREGSSNFSAHICPVLPFIFAFDFSFFSSQTSIPAVQKSTAGKRAAAVYLLKKIYLTDCERTYCFKKDADLKCGI